ncbi:sugar ABC transporter substrate-binding protein [Shinella sp.]|uniref:ABC transporter substrate-binding protein n=1 Tax=Shinella sp. TaxID=1870904 RepID=UPI0025852F2D|nr:sugar ABC transporter substrate-binding protein [Shinella sp.]MCW5706864.1 sugar ABC transporter substrate-binding protein [Shinella sp.]
MGNFIRRALATTSLSITITVGVIGPSQAAQCSGTIRVLAQPRDGLTLLENYTDEFKQLSGADFQIDYLNEGDRRAKSQADASTIGKYNVYYVDEANLALFASSQWIVPLMDFYPKEYDFDDFDPGRKVTATYDGKVYFAPILGGGDLMIYRKDLFQAAGLEPPKTLDELVEAVKKLHNPDAGVYGIALRGQRGSGANVWRWMPFFKGLGGEWFKDGKPAFDSQAAVDATSIYLDLFKYSAPGTQTGSWDEATGAFRSGQAALIIESAPLGGITLDKTQSQVADKVGFAAPPTPLTGGGFGHGFAIAAKANKDDASKACAGLFIAWSTSKENEQRRLDAGQSGELNRLSVINSDKFAATFGKELPAALQATASKTAVNFWQDPRWQELGNQWGIELEELITGSRTDIKASLDELKAFAENLPDK